MTGEWFMLYANCFLTEGASEGIIHDVHRQRYLPVKKRMAALLKDDFKQCPVAEVRRRYPDWVNGIDAYLNFLVENDYGFYTDEPQNFKPINLVFRHPTSLSSAIVEMDAAAIETHANVVDQLLALGCQNFQFLFLEGAYDFEEVAKMLESFKTSRASSVDLYFEQAVFDENQHKQLGKDLRIRSTVFNKNEERSFFLNEGETDSKQGHLYLFYVSRKLEPRQAEQYRPELFNLALRPFIEAQEHNAGLNKKVAIDRNGDIKNYLNHDRVFGNIASDSIIEAVTSAAFQKQWNISNDEIEKCKDCQFRYICFSNSYVSQIDGNYRKAEDCGFDPYTNRWGDGMGERSEAKLTHDVSR